MTLEELNERRAEITLAMPAQYRNQFSQKELADVVEDQLRTYLGTIFGGDYAPGAPAIAPAPPIFFAKVPPWVWYVIGLQGVLILGLLLHIGAL